jgi:fatty-acyl-CoA synthase
MNIPLTPIRGLYRGVDLYGKKVGVVSGNSRYTYAEFGDRCERLAAGLKAEGVQPGDRVAFLSFNNNQLLEGYYGAPLARCVVMPLNVRLTPAELTEILNHAEPRVLIFESDFAPLVHAFQNYCGSINRYVAIDGEPPVGGVTYEELLSHGRIDRPDMFSFDEDGIAELFYTSGSTGTPKGVAITHRTLYLHALSCIHTNRSSDIDVPLHTIPLFHANGWGAPQTGVMTGAKQVMVRRFEPTLVLNLIQEERATSMAMVPVMANMLLNCPSLSSFDLSSMQTVFLGGAAASPELICRLEDVFHCDVLVGYGLTETAPVISCSRKKATITNTSDSERLFRLSMAGWPVLGSELRVVDQHMNDVPRDMQSVGEVIVRSDHVMEGYYREPEATERVMTDGWFHTGDMAVWDEETYVHIVDRKKDIIISGGENISSIELEKAISAHPAVAECAVVAAPDLRWGEVPAAIVVVKSDAELNDKVLQDFLQTRVAKFKLPQIYQFVDGPLPKTGTGKILKRELREAFWTGVERRVQG